MSENVLCYPHIAFPPLIDAFTVVAVQIRYYFPTWLDSKSSELVLTEPLV